MATLHTELIEDTIRLEALIEDWDRLAVAAGRPFAAPGWCMAWWHHVRPPTAILRAIAVRQGDRLVGMAPLYCVPSRFGPARYRFLGAGVAARVEPVSEPGLERAAAPEIVRALSRCRPYPDVIELDGVPEHSPWPALLSAGWARGPVAVLQTQTMPAPATTLDVDDYDSWLGRQSRNFRQQARRHRRRLADRGATFRMVSKPDEAVTKLDDFERLHEARWRYRGGSGVLDADVMEMLREAAASLTTAGRFRLRLIEHGDTVLCAQVVLAAGDEASYWLGGFDDEWGTHQPSMQCLLAEIEHAMSVGDRRLDLGPGAQPYKERLADTEERLIWIRMLPPGPRQTLSRLDVVAGRIAASGQQQLYDLIPRERKDQIKRLLRRVRR